MFVLKTLAFFICRGTHKSKTKILYDFIEPTVTAYNKKRIPHFSPRLKKFFYNAFFFADTFVRRFEKNYKNEIYVKPFKEKTGIPCKPFKEEEWSLSHLDDMEA